MSTKSWLTDDDTVAHFKGSFNLKVSLTHEYVTVLTVILELNLLKCLVNPMNKYY